MKKKTNDYLFSATDLSKYLSCSYATWMDKGVADGVLSEPKFTDPHYFTIKELGLEHERRYVKHLEEIGLTITTLSSSESDDDRYAHTITAMKEGIDVIVQAKLEGTQWHGYADILRKVLKPSDLGDWSYEVMDTKLGQETQAGAVLQLCVYSELLSTIQGVTPDRMYIVKPGDPFVEDPLRFDEFSAYYRWIKRKFESSVPRIEAQSLYPDPVSYCDTCRWWSVCDKRRREDDHLSFVAGLHQQHAIELTRQGLPTLTAFAQAKNIEKPVKGNINTYQRLQLQAKMQLRRRETKELDIEHLEFAPGEGFSRLPEPDEGDVFFDFEGDHFYPDGGIEYLFGIAYRENGQLQYNAQWAFNRTEELAAFNKLMAFLMNRWEKHPGMHIYHFAPYEPSAVKRLMLRYNAWPEEVDKLLRGQRFVDLHAVLKQSLRAGVEKYSLKEMEPYYSFMRSTELKTATQALRNIQRALELRVLDKIEDEDRQHVAGYNKEDCLSALALRNWLEKLRAERIAGGEQIERPVEASGDADEKVAARAARIKEVYDRLIQSLPENREDWNDDKTKVGLLANLLDYFRREDKNFWWEYFRINDLEPDELLDERRAIHGLKFKEVLPIQGKGTLPTHRYQYPPQEFSGKEGEALDVIAPFTEERITLGKIVAHDLVKRTIDVKKTKRSLNLHPQSLQINDFIGPLSLEPALLSFAKNVLDDGIEGTGKYQAGRDLLFRRLPRFRSSDTQFETIRDITQSAIQLSSDLKSSILAIQGPPGTGKTYNGGHMICTLHKQGKRIGVTAVSHKAIDNLLQWVHRAAEERNQQIPLAHKGEDDEQHNSIIKYIPGNHVEDHLDNLYVVGGTAYLWSSDTMEEKLDYLFIDEAGQMSLAYALAVSRCAKNLVLLGDPQQLDQPQKAAHPDGADVSALQHYIGDHKVIESNRGLFLDMTWRLHPGICAFTSILFYEGKLRARAGLERQVILNNPFFGKQPLVYVPVEHSGNNNNSPEEINAIDTIVRQLLHAGTQWYKVAPKESDTGARPLTEQDIMIIAPYNAQVSALQRKMPTLHIGTVDKFQGQEAAVVIYSMTSSSAEDAPRGMSFLYLSNRLNVASSRAQCLFILVASPKLLEPDCKTPEQMKMANGLCAFREMT